MTRIGRMLSNVIRRITGKHTSRRPLRVIRGSQPNSRFGVLRRLILLWQSGKMPPGLSFLLVGECRNVRYQNCVQTEISLSRGTRSKLSSILRRCSAREDHDYRQSSTSTWNRWAYASALLSHDLPIGSTTPTVLPGSASMISGPPCLQPTWLDSTRSSDTQTGSRCLEHRSLGQILMPLGYQ